MIAYNSLVIVQVEFIGLDYGLNVKCCELYL